MASCEGCSTVGIIIELNRAISELEATLADHFEQHPDADIYLSLPGLGDVLGARVLGEFGDAPDRYANAKSRKNYAGTSPLTVAFGKKRTVLARHVRNRRLYDAIDQWAFSSITTSPGCRRFYDQHRAVGDLHHQALRALGNRLIGIRGQSSASFWCRSDAYPLLGWRVRGQVGALSAAASDIRGRSAGLELDESVFHPCGGAGGGG